MTPRPAAPAPLTVLQSLVNTRELLENRDDLTTASGLVAWAAAEGLPCPARPTQADLTRVSRVREALRQLLHGGEGAPGAAAVLNGELARTGTRPLLRADPPGAEFVGDAATSLDTALTRVLATLVTARLDGSLSRLKICGAEDCLWAYYDRSPNAVSRWCETSVCGARHKMRAYRARRAAANAN
ncbi:putative RNA-binding Zn ribbon-like protein [Amycolatopsis lexingtonensis]|uniref:RNA-binding Zn ribbon-like protein n=1 Tax=Amycolatopsis lexingtonensis TaxID=218822 RepID=A0ABR9HWZ9_9PSEU|nr:CGNR zinc finger domain-containing protein [Amycolatopsis lexingtonensis]MBE1495453.1 putative RNA-binding Zn ribbon-like protein [Amycolatopsis lexingtonensis]